MTPPDRSDPLRLLIAQMAEPFVQLIERRICSKAWLYWPPGPMVGQVFDRDLCKRDVQKMVDEFKKQLETALGAGGGGARAEEWRCFHCGEVFTTVGGAQDHFGAAEGCEPGCLIDRVALEEGGKPERGRGLLMALRKEEAYNRQLRLDNENLDNDSRLYHELRSEVDRLTGGHGLRMELDYRDGEKIVLEQRVKNLEAQLAALLRVGAAHPSELDALRAALYDQWETNHAEHCGHINQPYPHEGLCHWPLPSLLANYQPPKGGDD